MFAGHRHRLVQRRVPDVHRLAGNRKHQIQVHVVKTGGAQGVEGFENHFARVNPAEAIQQFFIERLHAHGNAVHAKVPEQFGLVERDGGGIAFDGEFLRAQQVQAVHRFENLFPLAKVQQRGRAAAEENRFGPQVCGDKFHFADERGDVTVDQFAAGSFREEGAVRTLLRAERDVDVKTMDAIQVVRHGDNLTERKLGGERKNHRQLQGCQRKSPALKGRPDV